MRKGTGYFADVAIRYAEDVVAGAIPACWQIRKSCQRFLDDVNGAEWTFSAAKVERVCRFAELFPVLTGPLAAKKMKLRLAPWQVWINAAIFGLVDRHGLRKHNEALVMIPRKNGKSTFAATIALYMLVEDSEQKAEIYIGASKLNQADFCFSPCRDFSTRAEGFAAHYGVRVLSRDIKLRDGSFITRMIGDPPDGSNPHLAILDEAHENHNFAKQRQTMKTGMGARVQPLLITITTAGFNEAGDCRQLQAQCEQVLNGELTDARRFSAIYTVDKDDDWTKIETWRKANPNLGIAFRETFLQEQLDIALSVPSEKPTLLTKHLNVWQSSGDAWVNMKQWDANAKALPFDAVKGRNLNAWIGGDLSKHHDVTAIMTVVEVPSEETGENEYHAYPVLMLPELAVQKDGKNAAAYLEWKASGDLIVTPDEATDFAAVQAKLVELCGQFNVKSVALDRWQSAQMAQQLREQFDVEAVEYPQYARHMNPPMSRFEKLLARGQLKHDGNRMMRWMAGNVVAKTDEIGQMKPVKPSRSEHMKIDGFVSLMMALGVASVPEEETPEFHVSWA